MWVFGRLYLSYLCDIKLIRNKLYGVGNENLDVFLKTKAERTGARLSAGRLYGRGYIQGPPRRAPAGSGEEGKPLSMEERTQKLLRLKKLLDRARSRGGV